jgi:hypothetical protein
MGTYGLTPRGAPDTLLASVFVALDTTPLHQEVRMRWIAIIGFAVWILLPGDIAQAETIYTWTDADGVKRYSNSQPPEDARHVRTIEEIPYNQGNEDRNQQAFDQMVDEAGREADEHFKEQAEKKANDAVLEQAQRKQVQSERIAAQRAELQKKIDAIQGRALGPTFTQGMKDNQIKQIQDQIDNLESSAK